MAAASPFSWPSTLNAELPVFTTYADRGVMIEPRNESELEKREKADMETAMKHSFETLEKENK
jgi:hypothetical protein